MTGNGVVQYASTQTRVGLGYETPQKVNSLGLMSNNTIPSTKAQYETPSTSPSSPSEYQSLFQQARSAVVNRDAPRTISADSSDDGESTRRDHQGSHASIPRKDLSGMMSITLPGTGESLDDEDGYGFDLKGRKPSIRLNRVTEYENV
jgi:hypothetical protein